MNITLNLSHYINANNAINMKQLLQYLNLKRLTFLLAFLTTSLLTYAQVGIDRTSTQTPDASAELDVYSTTKGMLIPRIALTSTASSSPITPSPLTSLLVYNTAAVNDVTPGYYYWNGTTWSRLLSGSSNLSGSGTTNYLARWTPNGNTLGIGVTFDNGTNVGISSATPGAKLDVASGDIRVATDNNALLLGSSASTQYALHNYSTNSLWLQNNGNTTSKLVVATAFDWDRQIAIQYTPGTTGTPGGDLVIGQLDKNNANFTHGLTRFYTNGIERLRIASDGNVGIGNTSLSARFHVSGGGQILGTNGTSSNTRTLTILEDGDAQINFGSYPGAWTSALQIQNNDNSHFLWISPLDASNNARIVAAGSGLDVYSNGSSGSSGTFVARFNANGSVGTFNLGTMNDPAGDQGNNWITWGYRADNNPYYCIRTNYKTYGSYTYSRLQLNWHTGIEIGAEKTYGGTRFFNNSPGVGATQIMSIGDGDDHVRVNNYLFAQYLNSTDNSVGSGVTGVMVKAGDNYFRTGTAASVATFLGTSLAGNYIQNQYGGAQSANLWISGESRVGSWFRNSAVNTGLYNEATGKHFYSESASYWTVADNNGLIFRNNHASTITGYVYWDGTAGSNNFGLLSPSGNWRIRVDNSNTEAYGGFYASTSYIPFIYDRDNTGYYLDPNSNTYINAFQNNNTLLGWPGYNGITQGYGHYIWPGRNDGSGVWWQQSWYLGSNSSYGLYTNTGIYIAGTSWCPFIYDANNTGYYLDPNSFSNLSSVYVDNWFRARNNVGLYFENWGGGWNMTDGTWIRSYGGKSIYCDAQIRADGGLVSGGIGTSGAGYIDASRNIRTVGGSQGTLELTSDLPGYAINTYPTVKTSGSYMYFSLANAYSAYISPGGGWNAVSSRKKKENFEELDKQDILNRISQLEMYKWNYKAEDPNIKHIGPIAEDFWDKFRLNDNDCMVSHIDPAGVALAGIQALNENLMAQKKQVETLQANLMDFGAVNVDSKSIWVNFNSSFTSSIDKTKLPIVTVNSSKPGIILYVTEKNNTGFRVVVDSELPEGLFVDYVAMAYAEPIVHAKEIPSAQAIALSKVMPHHNQDMEAFADPDNLTYKNQIQSVPIVVAPYPENETRPEDTKAYDEQQKRMKEYTPPHDKDPNIIQTGPLPNPDLNVVKRAEEDKKNYVPVDENEPQKNAGKSYDSKFDANPSNENAPE